MAVPPDRVTELEADSAVNAPVLADVPPMAGGLANSAVTPEPDSDVFTTRLLTVSVLAGTVPLYTIALTSFNQLAGMTVW